MLHKIKVLKEYLKNLGGVNKEILWAQIWHDTIKGCEWIGEDFGVSPGRWAVGIDHYTLEMKYRVLLNKSYKGVLECGSEGAIENYMDEHNNNMLYEAFCKIIDNVKILKG